MVRINLLPKEILERRKYERFYPWVGLAAVLVFAAILLVYALLSLQVSSRNQQLQQDQQTASELDQQAQAFAVFEQKEEQLKQREQVASLALAGRIAWGKIANEISLVLPSEVWLDRMTGEQKTDTGPYDTETGEYTGMPATLVLNGQTPDTNETSMDEGYKSLAKTLVRLNDLASLNSVWLGQAGVSQYPPGASDNVVPVTVQAFSITSNVVVPSYEQATTSGNTAVPAPPSTPGN